MVASLSYAVTLENGTVFGPFTSRPDAERFAAFAAEEIDPAEVHVMCSPVTELLNWRDTIKELSRG